MIGKILEKLALGAGTIAANVAIFFRGGTAASKHKGDDSMEHHHKPEEQTKLKKGKK